jgi:adrenodoxin-NADP+ reductase
VHAQRFLSSYKVAIVGSGPSSCYTAKYLLAAWTKAGKERPQIDILERLPTPYGLVRYGVAPDHPEVKNIQNDFDVLFADNEKGIRFFGNVEVGRDVSISQLRENYHAVVLAAGCETDRRLGIPGEDLEGVLSAREFVAWYNGHPDFVHIGQRVAAALGPNPEGASVCVVGQGNVALDCARILAKGTQGLYDTDIASHALSVLCDGVGSVSIVGRRGHVQGAFTIKELRELAKLKKEGYDASFLVREDELDLGATPASVEELNGPGGRPRVRIDKLLREASQQDTPGTSKQVHLRFLLNPKKFEPHDESSSALGSVACERTRLDGDAGKQKAVGTGEFETLSADLALVSIGYKGVALPGVEKWFDASHGTMVHEHGRVEGALGADGGLYAVGWLKRGPTGIIGTNITDAKDTVATIVQDSETDFNSEKSGDIESLLSGSQVVDWEGYRRIEAVEASEKRSAAQPREKIVDIQRQREIGARRA